MRAGELTEQITVQRLTATVNADGTYSQTWTDLMTLRASYSSRSGARTENDLETYPTSTATFTTHYRPSISGLDRVLYNGRTYLIQGEPVHRRLEDMTIITAEPDRI